MTPRRVPKAATKAATNGGEVAISPVMAELLNIDEAVRQGRVLERLEEIRLLVHGESNPVRRAGMKAELARKLRENRVRDAADLAKSVFERNERDRGIGVSEAPSSTRQQLDANDLDLKHITGLTWEVIQRENEARPALFLVGGVPSWIETGTGAVVIRPLTVDRARHYLADVIDWRKQDGRPALPPLHVARDILACPNPPLAPLERVVGAPVFAADGTLSTTPGYHRAARVYYQPSGLVVRPIPDTPTNDDILEAVATVTKPIDEFPFVGPSERAHALSLEIVPFARAMIQGPTPLHLFEKPTPRTGATLLASALTLPVLGRPVAVMTAARDGDEWRKRITAKLIGGPAVILIDNLRDRLDSEHLSSVLTAWPCWSDRPMRLSEMCEIPNMAAWAATGNNPALSHEMAGRVVRCRLDRNTDRPWEWTPAVPHLLEYVTQQRAEIVRAVLVLIRAWLVRGRPAPTAPTLPGYEEYRHVIGGVLEVAQISGFLANRDEVYELADAEGREIRRFFASWFERHEDRAVGVSDVFPLADEVNFPLKGATEHGRKVSLGARLSHLRDRPVTVKHMAGSVTVRLEVAGEEHSVARWRLVPVGPPGKDPSRPVDPPTEPGDTRGSTGLGGSLTGRQAAPHAEGCDCAACVPTGTENLAFPAPETRS